MDVIRGNEEHARWIVVIENGRDGRREAGRQAKVWVNTNMPLPRIDTAVSMTDGVALLLGLGFGRVLPPWTAVPPSPVPIPCKNKRIRTIS